jgi:hypothetical protein
MKKDNKTIGIIVRFFTNNLPGRVGGKMDQIPFWTCGNVHLEANKSKGIKPQDEMFNYSEDIPRAIKEVMKRSKLVGVTDIGYADRALKRNTKK